MKPMSDTNLQMNHNLFAKISAAMPPDSTRFLAMPDGQEWTYGDVRLWSAKLANALVSLGVGKGDRVAIQAPKSPHFLFLYLACLRVGAVILPLNTDYTPREVSYFQIGRASCRERV